MGSRTDILSAEIKSVSKLRRKFNEFRNKLYWDIDGMIYTSSEI